MTAIPFTCHSVVCLHVCDPGCDSDSGSAVDGLASRVRRLAGTARMAAGPCPIPWAEFPTHQPMERHTLAAGPTSQEEGPSGGIVPPPVVSPPPSTVTVPMPPTRGVRISTGACWPCRRLPFAGRHHIPSISLLPFNLRPRLWTRNASFCSAFLEHLHHGAAEAMRELLSVAADLHGLAFIQWVVHVRRGRERDVTETHPLDTK